MILTRFRHPCSAVGLVVALVVLAVYTETNAMQTQAEIDAGIYRYPTYYLAKIGPKLGVHFTMEYMAGADTFVQTKEPLDLNVATLGELIKELEKKIDARAVLDRTNPDHPVVHLIDKQLGKKSEVLDRKIDLRYTGIVGKLAAELEKQGVSGIESSLSGVYPTGVINDWETRVDIDVKQKPIRDILTHSVDLDEYNWQIWTAKTYKTGKGEWKTQIRFTGPKPVGRAAP